MTDGNPTVEDARAQVLLWTQPYTGIARSGFASDLDALIEAVRQEERARLGACLECGGDGVGLVRTGDAYEHFDQGDYTVVDCEACAGTGRVERGEV